MRHGRRDSTHAEVRDELRALGASVADTGDAGHDFPDLGLFVRGLFGAVAGISWLFGTKEKRP